MATLARELPEVRPGPFAWLWEFLKHELAPYPGRVATVARVVLAATLVMIVCNTFRIPYAFVGGIYALFISRENPRATVRSAGTALLLAAGAVVYVVVTVPFVVSVPLLHFFWVIGSLFLAFYALKVLTNYVAFALVLAVAITIWDRHVSSETNVESTLDLLLVALIAVVVTSGVELVFRHARAGDDIVVPVADGLAAVRGVLICFLDGGAVDRGIGEKIVRLGMVGTSTLRRTLARSDYSPDYKAQMGGVIALVGRLVDLTNALRELRFEPSGVDREHLRRLAAALESIRGDLLGGRVPGPIETSAEDEPHRVPLLREMEETVALVPQVFVGARLVAEDSAPSEEAPKLIAADAFTNPEHLRFALKGCFAASACYFVYNAIDWPGMGVPVMLTCVFTALSTIGTTRQRQVLRFAGFVVGGIVIGMGAQMYLLPYLDSITGFTIFFMLVTALAAWFMTSSPRLSFFGLQMGAVFFVVNINQKFARETSLAVARDRVAGVFLGLLMMWLIFDQLWSVPAGVEMRRVFASTLRLMAQFTREPERAGGLHDLINAKFDAVRSLGDGILLEFGPTRREDLAFRDRVRKWQPQLRALFLMRVASSKYRLGLLGFALPEEAVAELRAYDLQSAGVLEGLADRVEGKAPVGEGCAGAAGQIETLVPLVGEIDRVTRRLVGEIG